MVVGLAADAAADPHLAHHLEHGLVGDARAQLGAQAHSHLPVAAAVGGAREDLRDRSAATASAFVAPPSATAEAAATLCSYVYLACLPSMVSSTSLPNARYIRRRCLTVPLGMERAREAAQRPMPESNSSAACLLVSTSCFTLRSVRIRTPPHFSCPRNGGQFKRRPTDGPSCDAAPIAAAPKPRSRIATGSSSSPARDNPKTSNSAPRGSCRIRTSRSLGVDERVWSATPLRL